MVITSFTFKYWYCLKSKPTVNEKRLDYSALAHSDKLQQLYQSRLSSRIRHIIPRIHQPFTIVSDINTLNNIYSQLARQILNAAESTLPECPRNGSHYSPSFHNDPLIRKWSQDQKKLRLLIYHGNTRKKFPHYRQQRNHIIRQIRIRLKLLANEHAEQLAAELQASRSSTALFRIAKTLKAPLSSDPPSSTFSLINEEQDNLLTTDSNTLVDIVTKWYKSFYNQINIPSVDSPWHGYQAPLVFPITFLEVKNAAKKLNNNRAPGKDGIKGELLKYASDDCLRLICDMLNAIFTHHFPLQAAVEGILIPLNKPGKTRVVQNTRPITLLNSIRKLLSIILLDRIYPLLDAEMGLSQCGFRRGRSATEIVWTYRWLEATAQKCHNQYHILGLDLSKAFDCINRTQLLDDLRSILGISEFRILKFLLANTTLQTRIGGKLSPSFHTTIGTPQGDALSPVLFIFYLHCSLRKYNADSCAPTDPFPRCAPAYADDIDYITQDRNTECIDTVLLPLELSIYNFTVNEAKLEHITISDDNTAPSRVVKKLGSKLGAYADIQHRIILANAAFRRAWKIWLHDRTIHRTTRLKIYNATILPIFLYNSAALHLTQQQLEKFDAAHRKHLRHILRIYHPRHITNDQLYLQCQSEPLSVHLIRRRWQFLGHILRLPQEVPAFQSMVHYFSEVFCLNQLRKSRRRILRTRSAANATEQQLAALQRLGASRSSLPYILHQDLSRIEDPIYKGLRSTFDLMLLRIMLAHDRRAWKQLCNRIVDAYKQEHDQRYQALRNKRTLGKRKRDEANQIQDYATEAEATTDINMEPTPVETMDTIVNDEATTNPSDPDPDPDAMDVVLDDPTPQPLSAIATIPPTTPAIIGQEEEEEEEEERNVTWKRRRVTISNTSPLRRSPRLRTRQQGQPSSTSHGCSKKRTRSRSISDLNPQSREDAQRTRRE